MGWKETAQSLMNMLGANQREKARLRAEIERLENLVAPPAVTVPTSEVGQALIDEAIERSLRPLTPAGTNPWRVDQFLDDRYKIVTLEILEEILERDTVHDLPFIPEFRDCDNYALRFMVSCYDQGYTGIALIRSWAQPHAYNGAFVVMPDGTAELVVIEPQAAAILDWQDNSFYSLPWGGILMV